MAEKKTKEEKPKKKEKEESELEEKVEEQKKESDKKEVKNVFVDEEKFVELFNPEKSAPSLEEIAATGPAGPRFFATPMLLGSDSEEGEKITYEGANYNNSKEKEYNLSKIKSEDDYPEPGRVETIDITNAGRTQENPFLRNQVNFTTPDWGARDKGGNLETDYVLPEKVDVANAGRNGRGGREAKREISTEKYDIY